MPKGIHKLSREWRESLSIAHMGYTSWNKGRTDLPKHTKETREKMSIAQKGLNTWSKGRKLSEETKIKISKNNARVWLGKKRPEALKRKQSETMKGKFIGENNPFYGRKHTEETKEKMSKNHRNVKGCNNSAWKGGIVSLRKRIRHSFKYRQWRSDVFTRDDFTCQDCDKRGGILNAHHSESFNDILEINDINTFEQAMYCEELWNINNGRTLCNKCHDLTKRKSI